MSKRTKLIAIVAGAVILVSLLATGVALAADPTPTPTTGVNMHDIFLSKLAARLGITVEKLQEAFTGARTDTVNQLAAEGKITPQQKEWMLSPDHMGPNGCGGAGGTGAGMMGGGMMGGGYGGGMMGGSGMMGGRGPFGRST